tara:strand:+ start:429 stop:773 length:345 start_codon:yes stop_codon:yes gene_type:complete
MQEQVLEYFEAYFGGTLNESTSDEEIMNAVYDLIDLTEAVLEAVEKDMIKIKLAPGTEIGHEMYGVGPGGKKTLLKKGSTKTPAVINGVIQGDRLDNKKFGTGNVYKPDTVQGK